MLSKNKSLVNTDQKGSFLSLPAHRRAGARATLLGGVFRKAKYEKLRRRESEGGAGIHFPHTPFSSRPARAKIIKIQRRDFRGKKFGFCSGQTAIFIARQL